MYSNCLTQECQADGKGKETGEQAHVKGNGWQSHECAAHTLRDCIIDGPAHKPQLIDLITAINRTVSFFIFIFSIAKVVNRVIQCTIC